MTESLYLHHPWWRSGSQYLYFLLIRAQTNCHSFWMKSNVLIFLSFALRDGLKTAKTAHSCKSIECVYIIGNTLEFLGLTSMIHDPLFLQAVGPKSWGYLNLNYVNLRFRITLTHFQLSITI